MRSLRYHSTGKPRVVLRIDDLPVPEPGPGEVRIRLTHRPINPADTHAILGSYGRMPKLPAVGGHEGMGQVDALGEGVDGLKVGQRVVPMGVGGTWQEFLVAPAERCFSVPDTLEDEQAAQLFVNPLTGLLMLEQLDLAEGQWLLQTAGTSQVGRVMTQLAHHRGLKSISIVRRADAASELVALGADEVIVAEFESDSRNVRKEVFRLTGGQGADGAVDGVAGRIGGVVARCLAHGATMLVYGGLSGVPLSVDAGTFIFRRITVKGFWRTAWFESNQMEVAHRHLKTLADLVAAGDLALPVEQSYDLAEYEDALEHARKPGTTGKVLLTG